MVRFLNRQFKINCFTHWNILLLLLLYNFENLNFYYINLYNINICWSFTIFITFNSGMIYDKNAFKKIRNKINCNILEFHTGNFILHTLPCIYYYYYLPKYIYFYDSLISLILMGTWCVISTNGTMDLSNIYISFNKNTIIKLYTTTIVSSFIIPIIYKLNILNLE